MANSSDRPQHSAPPPMPPVLSESTEMDRDMTRAAAARRASDDDDLKAKLGRLSSLGFEFVIAILVMGGIGYAIDRWAMGGGVGFTLGGIVVGLLLGTWRFIRDAMALTGGRSGSGSGSGRGSGPRA